jgi:hypothetical protein
MPYGGLEDQKMYMFDWNRDKTRKKWRRVGALDNDLLRARSNRDEKWEHYMRSRTSQQDKGRQPIPFSQWLNRKPTLASKLPNKFEGDRNKMWFTQENTAQALKSKSGKRVEARKQQFYIYDVEDMNRILKTAKPDKGRVLILDYGDEGHPDDPNARGFRKNHLIFYWNDTMKNWTLAGGPVRRKWEEAKTLGKIWHDLLGEAFQEAYKKELEA